MRLCVHSCSYRYNVLKFSTGSVVRYLAWGHHTSNITNLRDCFKRGSVQPGCILGGLRFQSSAVWFFKFVWGFQQQIFRGKTADRRLDLQSLTRQTKSEELRPRWPELLSFRLSLKALQVEPFRGKKIWEKQRNVGCSVGGRILS